MKFIPPSKRHVTCVLVGIGVLMSSSVVSQSLSEKKRAIVFSAPILYNSTTVRNVLGPQRDISGSGISNGISISYEQGVSKNVYVKLGTGLFTQRFNIKRPFFDFNPVDLGMATKKYTYNCYEFIVGGGFRKKITDINSLDIGLTYTASFSYKQTFVPRDRVYQPTVTNNSNQFAHIISTAITIDRKISQRMSFQYGLLLPIFTRWRKESRFSENTTEFYSPRFQIGAIMGLKYHF